ncbi:MAG: hypothetical protein M1816_004602 [Peltula sp. TS41687]|nr:MAG: hypothetical protein M1816_004602 [Peltula sp. TS41687]
MISSDFLRWNSKVYNSTIQKVQEARAKVLGTSDRVDRYKGQLDNLLGTLRLVQDERELQIPAVEEQIQAVMDIGGELKVHIDALAAWVAKRKAKQYMHALATGDRDEKDLDDILACLDHTKADVTTRIITAHVGLNVGDGMVPLTDEDVQALKLIDKVEWVENKAFDDAQMFNTDLIERQTQNPAGRLYRLNEAHGGSVVVQGKADAEVIAAIIRARRG